MMVVLEAGTENVGRCKLNWKKKELSSRKLRLMLVGSSLGHNQDKHQSNGERVGTRPKSSLQLTGGRLPHA